MKKKIIIFFLTSLTTVAFSNTYYVATNGSNSSGQGTIDSPWASISFAYSKMKAGDTLFIRGGRYYISETIPLWNQGTAEQRITISAYKNPQTGQYEEVILDGTKAITNWQPCTANDAFLNIGLNGQPHPYWDKIYKANLKFKVSRLFENHQRVRLACYPKQDRAYGWEVDKWFRTTAEAWGYKDRVIDTTNLVQPDGYWGGTGYVIIKMSADRSSPIQKDILRYENSTIFLASETNYPIGHYSDGTGDPYCIFNHPNCLTEPGMFITTQTPDSNGDYWIYYWPLEEQNVYNGMIRYPSSAKCFEVRWTAAYLKPGGDYHTIEGLKIVGFTNYPIEGGAPSGCFVNGLIIKNCVFSDNGRELAIKYLNDTLVEDCVAHYNEYFGILIGNGSKNITVKNCVVEENLRSQIYVSGCSGLRFIGNTLGGCSGAKGNGISLYDRPRDVLVAKNNFTGNVLAVADIKNLIVYDNIGIYVVDYNNYDNPSVDQGTIFFAHNIILGGARGTAIKDYNFSNGSYYIVNNALNGCNVWYDSNKNPYPAVKHHGYNFYTIPYSSRILWEGEILGANIPMNNIWQYIDVYRDANGNEILGSSKWDLPAACKSWDNNDYHLAQNSPLIAKGTPLLPILLLAGVLGQGSWSDAGGWLSGYEDIFLTDYEGKPWAETPSIGAYEFGTSASGYVLQTVAANGTVNRSPNKAAYNAGEQVVLTATPASGYAFAGWSGSVSGTTNPITITMDGNKTVTANFTAILAPTYTLTINAANGTVSRSPNKATYNAGEQVVLTATPASGYTFAGWSGSVSGATNPITITMDGNKTVTANFTAIPAPTYTLTINAANGAVNRSPNKAAYNAGEQVVLTATPASGYAFAGWSGSISGTTNPITITMDANKTVTANFTAIPTYTLTVNATAGGTVAVSPTKASYTQGEQVILTAMPNNGYIFSGWSGNASGTTATITITMDANKTITATFAEAPTYTLTITAVNGSVSISPNKARYSPNDRVTLTAIPDTGFVFDGWAGDITAATATITLTMDSNKTVAAKFRLATLASALVAEWILDNHYQSTVVDLVGKQQAALVNEAQWGEGWANENYVLMETGHQALQIPMTRCNPLKGAVAIVVRPESIEGMQVLFGHSIAAANRIALYSAAGQLAVGIGNTLRSGLGALEVGQTYHIALCWNGTQYTVYLNGQKKDAGTFSGLTRLETIADVGNLGDPAARQEGLGFNGAVESVQLYARALTDAEAAVLANTQYTRENRPVEFVLTNYDQQGNRILYTPLNLPDGATFDYTEQKFFWRPGLYDAAGTYNIIFTAPGQDNQVVQIRVLDTPLANWYKDFLLKLGKPVK